MISFKQFILEYYILVESRIDFLKTQFSGKLDTSHDTFAQHKDSNAIVDHFATHADPTSNKSHTQWILNQYKQKKIRQEDHPRIKETLSNFEKYKSKLPISNRNINSYKSLGEIDDAVTPHLGAPVTKTEKIEKEKTEGRELLHDSGNLQVYKLKTKEASQHHYGGGSKIGNTDWCTAARSKDCAFDEYNKEGSLYTIHVKNKIGEEKYQYHPATNQFMDARDKSVDIESFVRKHPKIKQVKALQGTHDSLPFLRGGKEFASKEFASKIHSGNYDETDINDAANKGIINQDHANNILLRKNSNIGHKTLVDLDHKGEIRLSPEHINTIINNKTSNDAHALLAHYHINHYRRLSPENINTIINTKNSTLAHAHLLVPGGYGVPKMPPEHVDTIVNNPNSNYAHQLLVGHHIRGNIKLSSKQINTIVNNPESIAAHKALLYNHNQGSISLSPEQLSKIKSTIEK